MIAADAAVPGRVSVRTVAVTGPAPALSGNERAGERQNDVQGDA